MAEISQTIPPSEEKAEESPITGLGDALRKEREKRGLTLDQVASITKLRLKTVEALENERWGELPAQVFVRGFIRSYAGILGLDGKELLRLYERAVPVQTGARKPVAGKPTGVRRRSRKWILVTVLVLALGLGVAIYLRVEHSFPLFSFPPGKPITQSSQSLPEGRGEKRDVAPTPDQAQPLRLPEAEPAPAVEGGAENQAMASDGTAEAPAAAVERPAGTASPQSLPADLQSLPPSPEPYVLKAVVVEETWVRIHIDNGESKEYIFQPGARPQWKAREGFQLTVGNAGGIELELNGAKLKSLGKPGKVVKRNLPESFRPARSED